MKKQIFISALLIPVGLSLVGCNEENQSNSQVGQGNRQASHGGSRTNTGGNQARFESSYQEPTREEFKKPVFSDPRDSMDASEGLCDAAFHERLDDVVYFIRKYPFPHRACLYHTSTDPKTGIDQKVAPAAMAVIRRNVKIFRVLIENSLVAGTLEIQNFFGNSFLHAAAELEDEVSLEILSKRSSGVVDIKNHDGVTPIFYSVKASNGPKLAEILLKHGANPNQTVTVKGYKVSIIEFALALEKHEFVNVLRKYSMPPADQTTIGKCIAEFASQDPELSKAHQELMVKINEARACSYDSLEGVLANKSRDGKYICSLDSSSKTELSEFLQTMHRAFKRNAPSFGQDHCITKGGDSRECKEIQQRLSACMEISGKAREVADLFN